MRKGQPILHLDSVLYAANAPRNLTPQLDRCSGKYWRQRFPLPLPPTAPRRGFGPGAPVGWLGIRWWRFRFLVRLVELSHLVRRRIGRGNLIVKRVGLRQGPRLQATLRFLISFSLTEATTNCGDSTRPWRDARPTRRPPQGGSEATDTAIRTSYATSPNASTAACGGRSVKPGSSARPNQMSSVAWTNFAWRKLTVGSQLPSRSSP